ncbi:MAG: sensor histidine kinase [Verrucomicrobiaceae bacterium]|nr:MAG: sensor histidine kinase [Verrucomicrobiaceae bacterium]
MKEELAFKNGTTSPRARDLVSVPWTLPEVRIVLTYFVLASLWIVGSDLVLTKASIEDTQAGLIQSLKGLNFVITTAVLLFFVLRRAYRGWRHAEMQRQAVVELAREKFQALSSRLQTLREEERTRISREIHDELGQLLTGIKMELRMVENRLSDRDDRSLNPAIDKLVEVSELVDTTIASVQSISAGLRPSTLDNLGLGTALMDEAGLFTQRTGIPCAIVIEDLPEKLPSEITTTAFRIFQEALTNIARHAEAHRIDSRVTCDNNMLRLLVHDDGRGIDPAAADNPKSLGLIGMLERAEHVGGEVVFLRNPQKGTDVILTVPLPSTETATTSTV